MSTPPEHLLAECEKIEENCLYTGQAHFEIAAKKGKRATAWLVLVPSLVSAASGLLVAIGQPKWLGAFAAISGVVSAVAAFLGIGKEAAAHESAGKLLTQLKDEARSLRETYSRDLTPEQLASEVRALGFRYRAYIASLPLTSNSALKNVQARVKEGTFRFDSEDRPALPTATPQAALPPTTGNEDR